MYDWSMTRDDVFGMMTMTATAATTATMAAGSVSAAADRGTSLARRGLAGVIVMLLVVVVVEAAAGGEGGSLLAELSVGKGAVNDGHPRRRELQSVGKRETKRDEER